MAESGISNDAVRVRRRFVLFIGFISGAGGAWEIVSCVGGI
jgi:hypothetical protein